MLAGVERRQDDDEGRANDRVAARGRPASASASTPTATLSAVTLEGPEPFCEYAGEMLSRPAATASTKQAALIVTVAWLTALVGVSVD